MEHLVTLIGIFKDWTVGSAELYFFNKYGGFNIYTAQSDEVRGYAKVLNATSLNLLMNFTMLCPIRDLRADGHNIYRHDKS